jgi:hypothetical protein
VRRKRIFYLVLGIWVALCVMWFAIDLSDDSSSWWFYWWMAGSGVAVAITGIVLLGIGGLFAADWERREIDKYLRQGLGARPRPERHGGTPSMPRRKESTEFGDAVKHSRRPPSGRLVQVGDDVSWCRTARAADREAPRWRAPRTRPAVPRVRDRPKTPKPVSCEGSRASPSLDERAQARGQGGIR